jgi:hypothetical protein
MTSSISRHPLSYSIFAMTGAAKIINQTRWFSKKLSDLKIEQILLDNGRVKHDTSLRKLHRSILIHQTVTIGFKTLSRIPLFFIVTAIMVWNIENFWKKNK